MGARRGRGAGLSSQQIKKWAGVLPSVPEETEAQGGQVVPKSSSESWDYKAHGFVGGRGGRGAWSRPWAGDFHLPYMSLFLGMPGRSPQSGLYPVRPQCVSLASHCPSVGLSFSV